MPIIILGSFLNLKENITRQELKKGVEEGKIFCAKDISGLLQSQLSLAAAPATLSLSSFNHTNDSPLIITSIDSVTPQFLAKDFEGINFFKNHDQYKLWTKPTGHFQYKNQITSYTHIGVTALTRQAGNVLDRKGIGFYLENILPYFKNRELVHISNEVSNLDSCSYPSMKMKFATKTAHFEIFKILGVDIVELTGNHNLDVGKNAYLSALQWYEQADIRYYGGGRTPSEANKALVLKLKDGSSVAWIGFNQTCPLGECADVECGANRYSDEKAKRLIGSVKKIPGISYIISSVQFTEADTYTPITRQKEICKNLIDYGADVVLGSQAHQAQEIGLYKDKIIFYGLGNFMFDQIHRLGVRQAFFLECYFYKGKIIQYQPVYTFMNDQRQPAIASQAEKREIQKSILKPYNFVR
jgi:poly-gamma-glutamate capsule biosynthesis protein CapA/YwtB (metallophosphatase superfamily)